MATTERERLAIKGKREPNGGMLEQSEYSIKVGETHEGKLATVGFTAAMLQEMREKRSEVAQMISAQSQAKASARGFTRNEVSVVSLVRDYLYKIKLLVPIAVRVVHPEGVTVDDFIPETKLRNSAPRLMNHLDRIRPLVAKVEEGLKPGFGGESPLASHDRLREQLGAVAGAQAERISNLPEQTLNLHAAKGRLLELIEDLNRFGRVAFIDQAEIAGRFNKDILLRARRRGGDAGEATTTPAATTPAANPQ